MKKILIYLMVSLLTVSAIAQGYWTQKADFSGDARYFGSGMAIGDKGYIGLGSTNTYPGNNDFWQYNPAVNAWAQISDFYNDRIYSACFSIGNIGYVCTGCYWDGTSGTQPFVFYQDLRAYDPSTNTWTQKADFPGTGRNGAFGFEINGKGYVGMGLHRENSGANTYYNDLYEYNPLSNLWTQKANLPGSERSYCINFSVDKYIYVGLGVNNVTQYLNDIWQYDSQTDTWTQKSNFPGSPRKYASSFVIESKGYVFGGMDATQFFNDLWEYDCYTDTWTQKESLPSYARYSSIGFSINGKGYIGTGYAPDLGGRTDELWEYTPSTAAIYENQIENQIDIYPNPATDYINILIPKKVTVEIININGQVIKTIYNNGKVVTIELRNLTRGIYIVKANTGDKILRKIFIKE